MARLSKHEKAAKAALAKAHKAIDAAVKAAKKADKSARKEAAALERKLEKALEKSRTVRKPGTSGKTVTEGEAKKDASPAKKDKPADKSSRPASAVGVTAPDSASPQETEPAAVVPEPSVTTPSTSAASEPTLAQLREQARAAGLSGFSRLNKADLSALLARQ